ncbi:acetyl-CoA acetyltransferase [Chloroflexota bacterium]
MPESIKDKVAIIGMGLTKWGEMWDKDIFDLMTDTVYEAMDDAGVERNQIEAAWLGTALQNDYSTGLILSQALQTQFIPVTRVENACGTGAEAIRGAAYGLASKQYDLVMAVGLDKMKDGGFGGTGLSFAGKWWPLYGQAVEVGGGVARYALAATAYFRKYGLSPEEGKRILGKISVKSHHNGARNPRAHLRREVTLEQVLSAPIVAWPLGLYDCCGVTDGSSAAIMCRVEDVPKYAVNHPHDYIVIKGFGIASSPGWGREKTDYDFTYWDATVAAAKQAYEQAGITNPREELSMIEVHDCFSIAELIAVESLGICEYGHAREDIDGGAWEQEGEIPVNISGGLKSFGHPPGASGGREVWEFYMQFQGRAQEPSRQLKDVKLGLAHNQGGNPGLFVCGITVVGAPS